MKTILVVDDEEVIRALISRSLSNLPIAHTVLTAGNGAEAIDLLRSNKVDLVITDLSMPVMDGFAFLAYIADKHPAIEKIAMTGLQSADVENKLHFLGVTHFMIKPFDLGNMIKKILYLFGHYSEKPAAAYYAQHAIR